jgi:Domain of Unknown Function (DUF1206)
MLELFARLGYASKAMIYAIVGGLAIAAATNRGGRVTDTSGALRVILTQPFGRGLLFVLAAGLCGYAAWRILDSIIDPDRNGTDFDGLVTRIGNTVRGIVYGALGVEAFRLARGLGGSNGNDAEMWTARIMDWPLGVWLIALAGAIVTVYGGREVIRSVKGNVDPTVDYSAAPARWRQLLIQISRFGIGARGMIIVTLGIFLVRAAVQHDPSEAHGTRESVIELANAASGRWLLAAIAAGLIAYAVDQAAHAMWRRIRPVV